MKLILAFDSFKNCMPAETVCRIFGTALRRVQPDWNIVEMPVGDGGEGTSAALTAALRGTMEPLTVHDPLGRPVTAHWGKLPGNRAVLEMAQASGLELLKPEERDPLTASSFGTGELIRILAEERRIGDFILGIGGSATVDGGTGMLQALGVRFLDVAGKEIPAPMGGKDLEKIALVDESGLSPAVRSARFRVACDVTNPLLGETGAAAVFGPQKGATPVMVTQLEQGLATFAAAAIRQGVAPAADAPGDGAAGGMGFALRNFLGAEICSGADMVLDAAGFEAQLADCDWVITGEGRSDEQTLQGKLCSRVADRAAKQGVPTILLSGALGRNSQRLAARFAAVLALAAAPGTLEKALAATAENLERMGYSLGNLLSQSGR